MSKRKVAPRFFVFMILFIGTIFSIVVYATQLKRTTTIKTGVIEFKQEFDCVVIRDEDIIEVDEFGKVEYHVPEGASVLRGELVASTYELSYNEKTVQDLINIQQSIQDYQEHTLLKGIVDVELESINDKIRQKALEIRESINYNNDTDLLQLERELDSLMQEKEAHLKSAVKPDETLNGLYIEKEEIMKDISTWKTDMYSESSGVISFYYDGYEKTFNMQNLDTFEVSDIRDTLDGADVTDFYSDSLSYPIYKLVNSTKWYISVFSETSIPEFNKNTYFTMIFGQNIDEQFTGELLGKRNFPSGYIYTFEFSDPIRQMLDTRTTPVEMYNKFEGFIVPTKAIMHEKGDTYLLVVEDKEEKRVPIKVATIDDDRAVVNHIKGFAQLKEGDKIRY